MSEKTFAELVSTAKIEANKTFREMVEFCGEGSIGYFNDVAKGRKRPPDIALVEKWEKCLGVTDGRLVAAANREKQQCGCDCHARADETRREGENSSLRELVAEAWDGRVFRRMIYWRDYYRHLGYQKQVDCYEDGMNLLAELNKPAADAEEQKR